MKIKFLILVGLTLTFSSCTNKESATEQTEVTTENTDPDEWPQMDSFHMIMAEAFHPYKDSANLAPIKVLAEEIASEAETWAASSLPEKVDNDEVKDKLAQLKTDTRALADKIKGGASDEEIGSSLKALHDSFHEIMETWNGDGEMHEHEH
jgi:PBP1b-binding outer membrane lipoprotein LpoB